VIRIVFIVIIVVSSLVACNKAKEEVIDLNDIIAESDRYKEVDEIVGVDDAIIDSTQLILQSFSENGIDVNSLSVVKKSLFPDRFGPEYSDKYLLENESDTIKYFNWKYTDSSKTVNAFFNWIDNFGTERKSLFIGEEKNLQKEPFLLFVGDTSLIFIEAKESLQLKKWEHYFKKIGYNGEWNYVLQQRKWGKVKWD